VIVTAGLDLSLASTGLAVAVDGEVALMGNIKSSGKRGDKHGDYMPRIISMAEQINDWLADAYAQLGGIDLAAIEAPSFNSRFGNPHERAGLWWKVYEYLWTGEVPIETIAPASRAKFITGSGKAGKDEVLATARAKWGEDIENHDVADAVGMAMWGQEQIALG
jgi:Holliday junction resolvasome RuvABC endonuclease subunit